MAVYRMKPCLSRMSLLYGEAKRSLPCRNNDVVDGALDEAGANTSSDANNTRTYLRGRAAAICMGE